MPPSGLTLGVDLAGFALLPLHTHLKALLFLHYASFNMTHNEGKVETTCSAKLQNFLASYLKTLDNSMLLINMYPASANTSKEGLLPGVCLDKRLVAL